MRLTEKTKLYVAICNMVEERLQISIEMHCRQHSTFNVGMVKGKPKMSRLSRDIVSVTGIQLTECSTRPDDEHFMLYGTVLDFPKPYSAVASFSAFVFNSTGKKYTNEFAPENFDDVEMEEIEALSTADLTTIHNQLSTTQAMIRLHSKSVFRPNR